MDYLYKGTAHQLKRPTNVTGLSYDPFGPKIRMNRDELPRWERGGNWVQAESERLSIGETIGG